MFKTLKCSEIHCGVGVAYYYKGDLDKSIGQLIRATEINGENALHANNLTELRKIREDFYEGS